MPLYRATAVVRARPAAVALRDALDALAPPPLASEVHDHDDGSGRWDAGGLFDGPPDAAGLALLAQVHGAPDFSGRARRRPRLGGAGAGRADAGRGRAVRGLRQPRPRRGCRRTASGSRSRRRRPSAPGTTRRRRAACVALDRLAKAGFVARRVADIGGGTGVLAMAAARLWPAAGGRRATSTRWRRRRRGRTSRRTASGRGSPASPPPGFRHPRLRAGRPTT